eukprot:3735237-Prymnesium_polylepis.2
MVEGAVRPRPAARQREEPEVGLLLHDVLGQERSGLPVERAPVDCLVARRERRAGDAIAAVAVVRVEPRVVLVHEQPLLRHECPRPKEDHTRVVVRRRCEGKMADVSPVDPVALYKSCRYPQPHGGSEEEEK